MTSFLMEAQQIAPQLQGIKDDLHRHPELSAREHRTTAFLRRFLAGLGLVELDLGMETGAAALLCGGMPGGTVALRADIDAIAQQERADGPRSAYPGVMHACGHDFHTACLCGAAQLLSARRPLLRGDVLFLFQPAEETTSGAAAMLRHGLWQQLPRRPDFLFGLHNRPELPAGQVAVMEGAVMAGKSHFQITLHGLAGHGGSPHKCLDVIVAGAALVTALQTVVSRSTDPLEALVCSVCSIQAGTPDNFVPDTLKMTGSIRALNEDVHRAAEQRVRALAQSVPSAYGCSAEFTVLPGVPATRNSAEMTRLARAAAAAVVDASQIVAPPPDMAAEDFSLLAQEIPAFYYWLGSGFAGGQNACWHSDRFRTDDSALPVGAALLAQSAWEALRPI